MSATGGGSKLVTPAADGNIVQMSEIDDDRPAHRRDNVLWNLVYAALLSGGASGTYIATTAWDVYTHADATRDYQELKAELDAATSDRYTGADSDRDLQLLRTELRHQKENIQRLERIVERIDGEGPRIGNAYLRETLGEMMSQQAAMQRQLDRLENDGEEEE